MDHLYKKKQLNQLFYKDIIAQPFDLMESLRIRDGLVDHERSILRWPQSGVEQFQIYGLKHPWACNN